jgi:hypothetical protein
MNTIFDSIHSLWGNILDLFKYFDPSTPSNPEVPESISRSTSSGSTTSSGSITIRGLDSIPDLRSVNSDQNLPTPPYTPGVYVDPFNPFDTPTPSPTVPTASTPPSMPNNWE